MTIKILWLWLFLGHCSAFIHYYNLAGNPRCFSCELSPGALLVGQFSMEILHPDTGLYSIPKDSINTGLLIDVYELFDMNKNRVVHQRALSKGQFTFYALQAGEHKVCFTPKNFYRKKWFGVDAKLKDIDPDFTHTKVSINFESRDAMGNEYVGEKQKLAQEVFALNDKLMDIRREQEVILLKERMFRDQLEQTCSTVLKWLLIMVISSFFSCIYQAILLNMMQSKVKED